MADSKKKTPDTPTQEATTPAHAGMAAAMAAFSPGAASAWFEIMQESLRFMAERLEQDMDTQREMLACKTPQELMQVQSAFYKRAVAQYTEETQRMLDLMGVALKVTVSDKTPTTKRGYDDVPV